MQQVHLEIIDIWHFGLSALFQDGKSIEQIAAEIESELSGFIPAGIGVKEATEALALHCLQTKGFSPTCFWESTRRSTQRSTSYPPSASSVAAGRACASCSPPSPASHGPTSRS